MWFRSPCRQKKWKIYILSYRRGYSSPFCNYGLSKELPSSYSNWISMMMSKTVFWGLLTKWHNSRLVDKTCSSLLHAWSRTWKALKVLVGLDCNIFQMSPARILGQKNPQTKIPQKIFTSLFHVHPWYYWDSWERKRHFQSPAFDNCASVMK